MNNESNSLRKCQESLAEQRVAPGKLQLLPGHQDLKILDNFSGFVNDNDQHTLQNASNVAKIDNWKYEFLPPTHLAVAQGFDVYDYFEALGFSIPPPPCENIPDRYFERPSQAKGVNVGDFQHNKDSIVLNNQFLGSSEVDEETKLIISRHRFNSSTTSDEDVFYQENDPKTLDGNHGVKLTINDKKM